MSRIAVGLGCRSGCDARDVVGVLRAALAGAGRDLADVDGFYVLDAKADEAGLQEAAQSLGKTLHRLPIAALHAQRSAALTASPRVQERFGVPSLAETAALAGACLGSDATAQARLLGPRLSVGGATCALAVPGTESDS